MGSFNFELKRKFFHILGIIYPLIYLFFEKYIFLFTAVSIIPILSLEILRLYSTKFRNFVDSKFAIILRKSEINIQKPTGVFYTALSVGICIFLFPKDAAILSLTILIVSDALAAIIGKKFGKIKIFKNKTLEGSLTFFISSLITGLIYIYFMHSYLSSFSIILASIISTLFELFDDQLKIDDNLSIPVSFVIVLYLLN